MDNCAKSSHKKCQFKSRIGLFYPSAVTERSSCHSHFRNTSQSGRMILHQPPPLFKHGPTTLSSSAVSVAKWNGSAVSAAKWNGSAAVTFLGPLGQNVSLSKLNSVWFRCLTLPSETVALCLFQVCGFEWNSRCFKWNSLSRQVVAWSI